MYRTIRAFAGKIKRRVLKLAGQAPAAAAGPVVTAPPLNLREWAANTYLHGQGVEVGALHSPLPLPPQARVKYIDRMPVPQLLEQYPELASLKLVNVDIVDDGEKLTTLPPGSQDFLIANHFIEHCGDPIGTLKNFLRVLRPDGILYLAAPDKRYTFDIDRPVTSLAHLWQDHEQGPEASRRQHFEEWVRLVGKMEEPEAVEAEVNRLLKMDYSIHYHVWTQNEFLEMLQSLKQPLGYEIEVFLKHGHEMITVLRKCAPAEQNQDGSRRGIAA